LLLAAISFSDVAGVRAWAAGNDMAKLTAAIKDARATLQNGIKASECVGTPISAKFEIKDGKLRLSVYTVKGGDFTEVVVDPKTGSIVNAEKISDAEDLTAATAQKAAMAKVKMPLLIAAETSVSANRGFRAVSIFPENDGVHAEVTLLAAGFFKKFKQRLDCGYNPC
jgi:hypothetical protein